MELTDLLHKHGGAVQVEFKLTHWLETARFQPLSLSSDILVSKFAFLSNATCTATARRLCVVGLHKLNPV
jgi:hypothetical protein